ncbi:MAG: hypothetical protein JWP48_3690 [Actinoallomurus sp.]|nr:hypothetical protein [Actinoallomurus sp.]
MLRPGTTPAGRVGAETVSPHATWAYSWRRPHRAGLVGTLMAASMGSGSARSGLAWSRARCGRCSLKWASSGLVVIAHRPADHRFGVAVDDGRQINPAFPRRDIGDVTDHLLARRIGGEVTPHQVGDVVLLAVAAGEAEPPRPGLTWLQAQLTHEGPDKLGTAANAPGHQVGVDPPVPVGSVGIVKRCADERFEFLATFRGRRRRPGPPFAEA